MGTVAEVVRDEKSPLGALVHELERFDPSLDDLIDPEDGRFASLVAAIKYRAVNERALVVATYAVGGLRTLAVARLEHRVLKSGSGGDDSLLLGVGLEERLSFLLGFGALLLLQLGEERVEESLRLIGLELRLALVKDVVDGLGEVVDVKRGDAALQEVGSDVEPEGVAGFGVHVGKVDVRIKKRLQR